MHAVGINAGKPVNCFFFSSVHSLSFYIIYFKKTKKNMAGNPALDAQSKVGAVIGLSVGFATLSTVIVSCRIYTRTVLKSTGIDDAFIIAGQVRPTPLLSEM